MQFDCNTIILINGTELEDLGFWPDIFNEADPRPAAEQINERYAHGGGWRPMPGFTLTKNLLSFPGDPPLRPRAMARLHDKELLVLFEHDWTAIIQPDKSFEVSRID